MKALPRNTILTGDAREVLAGLLPESVDCVVTSPPYANALRDYGVAGQLGRESSITEYVEHLVTVLRGVRRLSTQAADPTRRLQPADLPGGPHRAADSGDVP